MSRRPDVPPLRREDLDPDPITQFSSWWALATERVALPEAMTLATVDAEGTPDARTVLLKGFDSRGFRFFTNADSAKGRQLRSVPRAALVLYWRELDRQVRARGRVEPLADEEADDYFRSRPRDSQLGAWASPQSSALRDRAELERRLGEAQRRFGEGEVARPEQWGGFLLVPLAVELWQGRDARLHDRFRYRRPGPGEAWVIERLAP